VQLIDRTIAERIARLTEYFRSVNRSAHVGNVLSLTCPITIVPSSDDHVDWTKALKVSDVTQLEGWLRELGNSVQM
jgi:hypothetical protein